MIPCWLGAANDSWFYKVGVCSEGWGELSRLETAGCQGVTASGDAKRVSAYLLLGLLLPASMPFDQAIDHTTGTDDADAYPSRWVRKLRPD